VVTVKSALTITLSFNDQGSGAFSQGTFTVNKSGAPNERTQSISLLDTTWDSVEWRVDNQIQGGAGNSFTVDADDYTAGGHTLTVTVSKNGVPWTKKLDFTVSN
jgi:hypothetical protein